MGMTLPRRSSRVEARAGMASPLPPVTRRETLLGLSSVGASVASTASGSGRQIGPREPPETASFILLSEGGESQGFGPEAS